MTLNAKSNFLFVSQAIKKTIWNENLIVGNESLRAVFHGPFQLLIFFKNFPSLQRKKKTFPCNRVTKNSSRKEKNISYKKNTWNQHCRQARRTKAFL